MKHKTKLSLFFLSSSILCSILVFSSSMAKTTTETAKDLARMALKEADKNNDKKLSKDESKVMPVMHQNFEEIDKNNDGYLSSTEMANRIAEKLKNKPIEKTNKVSQNKESTSREAFPVRVSKNLIRRKDKNGDKLLSKAELSSRHSLSSQFKKLDKNKDRLLSQKELEPYYDW